MPVGRITRKQGPTPGRRSIQRFTSRLSVTGLVIMLASLLSACDGNTELMKHTISGEVVEATAVLDKGGDVNAVNNYGWTALAHAARQGDSEMVVLLLERGAVIDTQDQRGWTALMRATSKGRVDIIDLLISKGADVEKHDSEGWTALLWAVNQDYPEAVKHLIKGGADVNVKARDGRTAMMIARSEGMTVMADLLKAAGASLR